MSPEQRSNALKLAALVGMAAGHSREGRRSCPYKGRSEIQTAKRRAWRFGFLFACSELPRTPAALATANDPFHMEQTRWVQTDRWVLLALARQFPRSALAAFFGRKPDNVTQQLKRLRRAERAAG